MLTPARSAMRFGPLVVDVAARFPLSRAADAYRALDAGAAGKVLVVPDRP
jgi:NADPH2:quinone reductase